MSNVRPDPVSRALTQQDGDADNGTWEELDVKNDGARAALFGAGNKSGGLISGVLIGGEGTRQADGRITGQNPLDNIEKVLTELDVTHKQKSLHHNHFHIFMRAPTRVDIDPLKKLLAQDSGTEQTKIVLNEDMRVAAQTLLDELQPQLDFDQGDIAMLLMDVPPEVPAMYAPVVIAQASQAQDTAKTDRTIGVCHLVNSLGGIAHRNPLSPIYVISPSETVRDYLGSFERKFFSYKSEIKVTLLQGPEHGELKVTASGNYRYTPVAEYIGADRATLLVEIGGLKVKAVYHFKVMDGGASGSAQGDPQDDKKNCPNGEMWKISLNPDDPAASTYSFTTPSQWSSGAVSYAAVSYGLASFSLNFADLPDSVVGQTTSQSITLDTNAAGHGWYIDPTPLDNSDDYLPTSNPDVWQAKAGTDAAGKMDLLSVLLHEYGHALGLEHSANSGDFMAVTLQPGQRRLPSAEELQLMSELVAQIKGSGTGDQTPTNPVAPSLPLGALLLGRLALGRRPEEAGATSQALFAAHPTLQGGSLQNLQDWATQGQVSVASGGMNGASGGATLQEGAASQTRLNQVFTLNERDRFLSFTLAGTALDDPSTALRTGFNGGPDDAFEVALLDANTGRSLAGALSLSHTDALLNLQANGIETAAANVTRVTNPDGSRTYRVDLAGIAAGTAVNLSFDLIGFGQAGSQVTVRDVRVSGLPELHDDAATLAEDATLAFNPFAQVDNPVLSSVEGAALLALGSQVVDAPTHGSVSLNLDGTFVYTPAQDYFGEDSFTYRLNDGPLQSNLATVYVTVAAVNDAPVVADVQASTAEDSTLVLALGAQTSLCNGG